MNGKSHFKWVLIGLAVFAGVATVGWISNVISRATCQQQVGSWLLTRGIGVRFFYLLDSDEDKGTRAAFDSMGATYSVLGSNSHSPNTWPRLSMKTHTLVPFFISVDYFWEREAEIGGGATKWFVCVFGRVVEIGETNEFAT
jgi:hypothetical protein